MENVLRLAIEALSWVELEDMSCSLALTKAAKQLKIVDRAIVVKARSLLRNALYRLNFIDKILDLALAPSSLKDSNLGVQSFLRFFVWITKFGRGDVKEAIELAREGRSILGWTTLAPVEEALGKILNLDAKEVASSLNDIERISFQTFYPQWFVSYCIQVMGRREALRFLRFSAPLSTYIRINTLKGNEEEILKEMSSSNIVLNKVQDVPFLYRVVKGARNITRLEAYANGLFSLQDEPSSIAILLCAPQKGQVILDVGVRPVTKTSYLSQLMNNGGRIFSIDASVNMIEALKVEAKRVGADNIEPIIVERGKAPDMREKADVVLLSPKCSGTGIFWREPFLKWRVDPKKIEVMAKAKWLMINRYADYVKDGGSLVYWTSSVTLEENEMVIERFLKLHPEFNLMETQPLRGVPGLREQRECQRLYPHLHGTDGSYFAKLIKNDC